jgi:hypothetical protein
MFPKTNDIPAFAF